MTIQRTTHFVGPVRSRSGAAPKSKYKVRPARTQSVERDLGMKCWGRHRSSKKLCTTTTHWGFRTGCVDDERRHQCPNWTLNGLTLGSRADRRARVGRDARQSVGLAPPEPSCESARGQILGAPSTVVPSITARWLPEHAAIRRTPGACSPVRIVAIDAFAALWGGTLHQRHLGSFRG